MGRIVKVKGAHFANLDGKVVVNKYSVLNWSKTTSRIKHVCAAARSIFLNQRH